jgi:hypothetical protein
LRCSKKLPTTTGPKESTQGNPNRAQSFIATPYKSFSLIANCTKSEIKCGMMMMLLHGDPNGGAVIYGNHTPMG